ncbi:hypothetical protein J552_3916 [Acinetobacter baumannii 951631]|nr:hypothetical protein J552_3916 [Acinetobacter baumannii 951631]
MAIIHIHFEKLKMLFVRFNLQAFRDFADWRLPAFFLS